MSVNAKVTDVPYETIYSNPPSQNYEPLLAPELNGVQSEDFTLKLWIRGLKLISRILSLICSSVVIALSIASFQIFLATKDLDPRSGFFPWARPTILWPQILTLVIAALSFLASLWVVWRYFRHGHRSAEKASWWTSVTTAIALIGWIVIWAAAAASLQHVRAISSGQDLWGWACAKNERRVLFQMDVNYRLICTMQEWNFICTFIQVATITASAAVWVVTFWRLRVRSRLEKGEA